MVQFAVVPETKHPVMAVVVSGGKQYRVAAGDQILVGRLKADVGAELKLDRVLLHDDGETLHVGNPTVSGLAVTARVLRHSRGPRLEILRYKSKKRVRVHKGARTDFTSVEILAIGDHRAQDRSHSAVKAAKAPVEGERDKAPKARRAAAEPTEEPS